MPNRTMHECGPDQWRPRQRGLLVYIEDNPANVALMEALISDLEGTELLVAPSAEIGLELVRTHGPDAVIMDIHLPGMSGFEATACLRGWPETRDIPVIALSAAAMVGHARQVQDAGFYAYLTKPLDVVEFAGILERLLPSTQAAP
jgi:CheY-like chemotaxis protein